MKDEYMKHKLYQMKGCKMNWGNKILYEVYFIFDSSFDIGFYKSLLAN